MLSVRIQTHDFDASAELAGLRRADSRVGAVVSFIGTVREGSLGSGLDALELEHYPEMTEKSIQSILQLAQQRFGFYAAQVLHRVGVLQPLDQIVLVAVSAAHRGEAFAGCEYIMDYLKTQAPFWKKERAANGLARWVDARESDTAALDKWHKTII